MATAGAGDVLCGIIVSLIGQGMGIFDAAQLGVYVHGLAGDIASRNKGEASMIATDILNYLPEAFLHYKREKK
jgi:NAD(P)H-hydrate epimerase